ncbi:MAG: MFS transporter [Armatimonadetes bacterium]|nr:MFS transporter [Armatimonadota bacterium]
MNLSNWLIFRHRNFGILWLGQLTSRIGTFVSYVALLMLVYQVTGSNLKTGITGIFQWLPGTLVGLYAGALIDRYSKKQIMIWTDILRALVSFLVPVLLLLGRLEIWHIYLIAGMTSLGNAFFQPAEMAIIPELVKDKDDLNKANAVARTTIQIGGIVGPPLGALLMTLWGPGSAFVVDGATFVLSAISLALIRTEKIAKAVESATHIWEDIMEGLRLIGRNKPLHAILLSCIAVNFTYYPLPILLPAISGRHFWDNFPGFNAAFIFSGFTAALTVGKVLASLTIMWFDSVKQLKYFIYYSLFLIALSVACVGLSPILSLSFVAMAIIGYGGLVTEVRIVSYIQTIFPEQLLGRVFSVIITIAFGTVPLSIGVAGWLADLWGPTAVLIGLGVGLVATGAGIMLARLLEDDEIVSTSQTAVFLNKY